MSVYISPNLTKKKSDYKPSDKITLPILQTSKQFELVLDPFMGSGTTGRVCDQLGRSFVGYDLIRF